MTGNHEERGNAWVQPIIDQIAGHKEFDDAWAAFEKAAVELDHARDRLTQAVAAVKATQK